MAEIQLLGLYYDVTQAADGIQALREQGVPDDQMEVMSGFPYNAEMLGRPKRKSRLGYISLGGAILGVLTALVLSAGLFLLYPLIQGGQPIVPIPPTLIVIFEVTMLGTMWSSFFGLLATNRHPRFREEIYDKRITEGSIGVAVEVADLMGDKAALALTDSGAYEVKRSGPRERVDVGFRRFWVIFNVGGAVVTIIGLLFWYDVLRINFPTNMADQLSIASEEGPRLAAPAAAIPVQGPVLIAGQPASEPIPTSANSVQRGKVYFGLICQMCHGPQGKGNGTVGAFFTPIKPADLTSSAVQQLSDNDIFLVLTQGFGAMPSMAGNLGVQDRWDVINYVRTLK
jgi:mono/diheme cytochrome c family protein